VAVNQVSLFFYPPRWKQRLTPSPTAWTDEGKPVQIAEAVPVDGADGPPVPADVLKGWLTERGFIPVEWGRGSVFERGQVFSTFGPEKEIEVSVGEEAGEVTELYCRFTLPRRSPPPVAEWAGFVAALCGRFGLRLEAQGAAPCGEAEFIAAVRDSRNYGEFAASFGWEAGSAEPATAPDRGRHHGFSGFHAPSGGPGR
jgi:hypothetical protein